MTKLEARGLALKNRTKLDIIFSKGFVKTGRKHFRDMTRARTITLAMTITLTRARTKTMTIILTMTMTITKI